MSKLGRFACCFSWCAGSPDLNEEEGSTKRWMFTLKELQSATNNFNYDNKIGDGNFGSVYWGQLWDRSQVAVKKLKVVNNKSAAEFVSDLEVLSSIKHKNLLSLRGYCVEERERFLVYDYMPNLSVYAHLHGMHSPECLLDWRRRMSIAIGAASGISFLHHESTPPIIHTGIRSSNVLLDVNFQALIADVGLAMLCEDGNKPDLSSKIQNEDGSYLAPEYLMRGKATTSSDVYSFGILLLELASGRRPIEKSAAGNVPIRQRLLPLARDNRLHEIADPKLSDKYVEDELKRTVLVGLLCSQRKPEKRPSMRDVLALLKGETKQVFAGHDIDEVFRTDSMARSVGEASTPGVSSAYASDSEKPAAAAGGGS